MNEVSLEYDREREAFRLVTKVGKSKLVTFISNKEFEKTVYKGSGWKIRYDTICGTEILSNCTDVDGNPMPDFEKKVATTTVTLTEK